MDWRHPERAWAGDIEGPVLRALWGTTQPMTGVQVARVADAGARTSVRYALLRLVEHGIVHAERVGGSVLYSLNRAHLTFPALDAAFEALDVHRALEDRVHSLRGQHYGPGSTDPLPIVAVFGSVARGEARLDSDVDLLVLVRNRDEQDEGFADALREQMQGWTGQVVQTYVATPEALEEGRRVDDPIIESFRRDARVIVGGSLTPYLGES